MKDLPAPITRPGHSIQGMHYSYMKCGAFIFKDCDSSFKLLTKITQVILSTGECLCTTRTSTVLEFK